MFLSSLILEGGGMRGVYTAGVLDFFLDVNLEFKTVIGVSAGACNACSYISKQKGRNYHINTDYLKNPEYLSFRNLLTKKSAFGMDFIFDDIPNKLNKFDYNAFHNSKSKLIAVSSNIESGLPLYYPINDMVNDIDYIKASISIPLLAKIVEVDSHKLLDGGICDSIPIAYAQSLGYEKSVVILTRDPLYRKGKNKVMPLIKSVYKEYPNFVKAVETRHMNYNNSLNLISLLKHQKKVFVIQPKKEVQISQLEKNKDKLTDLYKQGYQDAKDAYEDLVSFLK